MQRILDVKCDQKRRGQHLGGERLLASTSRLMALSLSIKASKPRSAKLSAAAPADELKTHFIRNEPASEREIFEGEGRVMARG